METIYESELCDVSYIENKNLVFVKWKKYCEFGSYRKPLMVALQVIKDHKSDYVADTRNGFENHPEDTKWVADYFMPKAVEYGCKVIYFIIDKDNLLKDELERQANNSADIISFRFIYDIDAIE